MAEKYLRIKMIGHEYINAYLNIDKKSDKHPDFKGPGVAVWIKEVREKEKPKEAGWESQFRK